MQKQLYPCLTFLSLLGIFLFAAPNLMAQEDEDDYDPSQYEAADDTKVKAFCNNKIQNLSPSNLISLSYDLVLPFDMVSTRTSDKSETTTAMGINQGFRLETNYPVYSKSNLIVNLYANYWQSNYASDATFSEGNQDLAQSLSQHPLRSIAVGALIFKPLNEKNFLIFQVEPSLNGNYNFGDLSPDFGKLRYSASALFGWKFNDNTNFAIGATRTYRGGRVLHIPILMWNKTFNERWGTEMLLPARASLRYNFSVKSLLLFGYELEGQTYALQGSNKAGFNSFAPKNTDLELRKSEIRARLQFRQALSNFIWLDAQAGARIAYRFDMDETEAMTEAVLENKIGIPLYFRVGIALVSP
jgi:hypothetical protein